RRVPASHARLDAARRRRLPAAAGAPAALVRRDGRIRDDLRRDGGAPLQRPRHGGDLRPSVAIRRSSASMKRALVVVPLVALALPATAFAHASLKQESPGFRQRLAVSPRQVLLQFDQSVDALPKAIVVLNVHGRNVAGPPRSIPSHRELVASLPRLPKGPYTIRWQALSNDGHIVSGVYTFGVGVPA